ncbi:MAG: type III pantothenate kinase [Pirellulales bacterium]
MPTASFPIIAAEIGNSRIKLGQFDTAPDAASLPRPSRTLALDVEHWDPVEIALWLAPAEPGKLHWCLSSVHRAAADRLAAWLAGERADTTLLAHDDLPLFVGLPAPDKAGIDRLIGAVAANHLRGDEQPAIVVDLGTAITVDVVSAEGIFCGGAILPGISMAARALGQFTDQLPSLDDVDLQQPPPAFGTSTDDAITSGIYWGTVGAVRTLVKQLKEQMTSKPLIVLTGGGSDTVADSLGGDVRHEPHLLLAGIALSAASRVE